MCCGVHGGDSCDDNPETIPLFWVDQARERDAVEYMEEILVTRTDIKVQAKQMEGLKNAVDELVLNNDYQLRLKDMNYKEKVRASFTCLAPSSTAVCISVVDTNRSTFFGCRALAITWPVLQTDTAVGCTIYISWLRMGRPMGRPMGCSMGCPISMASHGMTHGMTNPMG